MIDELTFEGYIEKLDHSNRLADVLTLVAEVNAALEDEIAQGLSDEIGAKLKEWLDKLEQKLRELARLHAAHSFSISVGTIVSVSVTFDLSG